MYKSSHKKIPISPVREYTSCHKEQLSPLTQLWPDVTSLPGLTWGSHTKWLRANHAKRKKMEGWPGDHRPLGKSFFLFGHENNNGLTGNSLSGLASGGCHYQQNYGEDSARQYAYAALIYVQIIYIDIHTYKHIIYKHILVYIHIFLYMHINII